MHRLLLTGGLCLALGACATARGQTPATCDGRHKRPANPNGSVLLSPRAAAMPDKAPPATPQPAPAASFAPCGDAP